MSTFAVTFLFAYVYDSYFRKGNGLETWQSSLLYVFVGYFGANPVKYERRLCVLSQLANRINAIV